MKPKTKKRLITYAIIVGGCLAIGGTAGIIAKRAFGPVDVDDSSFKPETVMPNVQEIYSRYENYSGKDYHREFTSSELVNIALEKYRRCENSYSMGYGAPVAMGVAQQIRSAQIKNGDTYFEESASKGVVGMAVRATQVGKDGDVSYHMQNDKNYVSDNAEKATYPTTPTVLTHDEYKKKWGKTLDEMFIYIISNKTVLSSETDSSGSNYVITLNLNPDTSTYFYKSQMVTISGLSSRPPFKQEKLTYTLSKDLDLIALKAEEIYTATMASIPVPAEVNATLNYKYFPNQYYEIPELNESIDYSLVKGE